MSIVLVAHKKAVKVLAAVHRKGLVQVVQQQSTCSTMVGNHQPLVVAFVVGQQQRQVPLFLL